VFELLQLGYVFQLGIGGKLRSQIG